MILRRLARRLRTSVALGLPPVLAPAMVFVPLGVLLEVSGEFTEWGPRMATLVVTVVAIHLIAGPILFRPALARAGEIGRAAQST